MPEALYEYINTEIKNHIHDEILWRIRGTFLSNEEILNEVEYLVSMMDSEAIDEDSIIPYLPKNYFAKGGSMDPIFEFTRPEKLEVYPALFKTYAAQTIERLNEALLKEQKTWKQKTDFDRLFLAVKELKVQGILFNHYDDMKGGGLHAKVEDLISEGTQTKAYFYTCDQSVDDGIQNSSYLRKRFLSQIFKEYHVYAETSQSDLTFSSRSCKGEFGYLPREKRSKEELREHHRMAIVIAKKLNQHKLRTTVLDDGLFLYIENFDWKLRRGEGASAAQKEVEQDRITD